MYGPSKSKTLESKVSKEAKREGSGESAHSLKKTFRKKVSLALVFAAFLFIVSLVLLLLCLLSKGNLIFGESYSSISDLPNHLNMIIPMGISRAILVGSLVTSVVLGWSSRKLKAFNQDSTAEPETHVTSPASSPAKNNPGPTSADTSTVTSHTFSDAKNNAGPTSSGAPTVTSYTSSDAKNNPDPTSADTPTVTSHTSSEAKNNSGHTSVVTPTVTSRTYSHAKNNSAPTSFGAPTFTSPTSSEAKNNSGHTSVVTSTVTSPTSSEANNNSDSKMFTVNPDYICTRDANELCLQNRMEKNGVDVAPMCYLLAYLKTELDKVEADLKTELDKADLKTSHRPSYVFLQQEILRLQILRVQISWEIERVKFLRKQVDKNLQFDGCTMSSAMSNCGDVEVTDKSLKLACHMANQGEIMNYLGLDDIRDECDFGYRFKLKLDIYYWLQGEMCYACWEACSTWYHCKNKYPKTHLFKRLESS